MSVTDASPRRRRVPRRRIVMGEINIVSHPHTIDLYIDAFKALHQHRAQAQYHGHRYIEIGNCYDLEDIRIPNGLAGRFFVFSRVNFDDPWLNMLRNKEATDAELEQIKIPPHLVPEFRQFRFIFDVRKHRLYYEKYSSGGHHISPQAVRQSLERLLHVPALAGMFDEIHAHTVADKEAVDRILGLTKLRRLFMRLYRPNPDDAEFEAEILQELDEQGVSVVERTLIKAPGQPKIIANALTPQLAHLAAHIGYVVGWGKDEQGAPVTVDTEDHPVEHNVVFEATADPVDKMIDYIAEKNAKESDDKHE